MNLANNRRFEVVMDEEIPAAQAASSLNIKRYVKLNHVVEFNQVNGGTIADITSGSLYRLHFIRQAL